MISRRYIYDAIHLLCNRTCPSKLKGTLQCPNQIAPSIGNSVAHSNSWFAQNYLGNDVATLVGIFSGPDSAGSLTSAAFSNALDNTGAPTSVVGIATGLAGSQPVVSGTKVAVRTTSNGAAYGADFVQSFAQTAVGQIGFKALSLAGLAKLGFDAISYGVAAYYCYQAQ